MALNLTTIDATNLFENNTPKTGLNFYTSNNEIIDKNTIGLSREEALKYTTRRSFRFCSWHTSNVR